MTSDRTLRIISIMKEEQLNATQFAEAIGIQRAAMSHIMNGRNNPSIDVIEKIAERFPSINPGWLLSGKGSMKIAANGANSVNINENTGNFDIGRHTDSADTLNIPQQVTYSNKNADYKSDLFYQLEKQMSNESHSKDDIRTDIHSDSKKREGAEVDLTENVNKNIEKEIVIYKESPNKIIEKLLIFYSDNTFETFIPEKTAITNR